MKGTQNQYVRSGRLSRGLIGKEVKALGNDVIQGHMASKWLKWN